MATSSITKKFVIKDEKALENLAKVLNGPSRLKIKPIPHKYEEGKKLLEKHFGHYIEKLR